MVVPQKRRAGRQVVIEGQEAPALAIENQCGEELLGERGDVERRQWGDLGAVLEIGKAGGQPDFFATLEDAECQAAAIGALVGRDEVVEAGLPLLNHVGWSRALDCGQYARLREPGREKSPPEPVSLHTSISAMSYRT